MSKRVGMAALALAAAFAMPAFARDTCIPPAMPPTVDGTNATADQMRVAREAVTNFLSDSDFYQRCVGDYVTDQKAQAERDKRAVDGPVLQAEIDKINANQSSKQMAGDAYNRAVIAFKKAHP